MGFLCLRTVHTCDLLLVLRLVCTLPRLLSRIIALTTMRIFSRSALIFPLLWALFSLSSCLEEPGPELPTLRETMLNDPQYAQMVEAFQAANLWDELDGDLFVTVFAPSNEAFDTFLVRNNLDKIGDLDADSLNNLISYHIQYGKVFEADFVSNYLTTPAAGPGNAPVVFLMELRNNGPLINNLARVTGTDVEADDGVLHTLDAVLYPPNIMEILEQNSEFSDFVDLINKAELRDDIAEGGPWTMFAPPNSVMEEFFDDQPVGIDGIDDLSIDECNKLVRFHLIENQHRWEELASNVIPVEYDTWLDDETTRIFDSGGIVINDSVRTFLLDVQGTNGVIHIVRDVMEYE